MKRYKKYKDSGIAWIGEIPEHWKSLTMRYIINILTDFTANGSFADLAKNVQYLETGHSRLIRLTDLRDNLNNKGVYVSKQSHEYLAKSSLYGGEVLVANVGAYAGLACVMPKVAYPATLGPNMFLLKYKRTIENRFILYALNSTYLAEQLINKAISSAQPKLNKENIRDCRVILPTISEQQQITNYLDWQCGEIDRVVATRVKQIELLKELRTSVISRAVTKGLDSTVTMKDSEIERIGKTPEHWDVCQYKIMAKICNGQDQKKVIDINGKYPIYGSGGVFGMSNTYLYNKPSILLGRKGTIDRPLFVDHPFWSVDTMFYTKIKNRTYPKYLYYLSGLLPFKLFATGTVLPSVTQADLSSVKIVCPPITEQQTIADYLDRKTAKIDSTIGKYKTQVEKLKEYRQALITEVVTGKIDVRSVNIPQKKQ